MVNYVTVIVTFSLSICVWVRNVFALLFLLWVLLFELELVSDIESVVHHIYVKLIIFMEVVLIYTHIPFPCLITVFHYLKPSSAT